MKRYFFLLLCGLFFLFPGKAQAASNQFITIVNPVRLASYTVNPLATVQAQYAEVAKRNLPASWLLTYDVMTKDEVTDFFKSVDKNQEIGVYMEVTPLLAAKAGIEYNQTDSWHRAQSIFLSGYSQADRLKLIDTIFDTYHQKFGSYPTSVGAWWIDAFSLKYMQDKYHITAHLICSDQLETDGYTLWGLPWSTPYYPSKDHPAEPANDLSSKLDLVVMQWAPRDPLNGFGGKGASLFSSQDYFTINLKDDFFAKLVNLYALAHDNKFGQMVIGLEGDLNPDSYKGGYSRQLDIATQYANQQSVTITNMAQFSQWYRQQFKQLSPIQLITSEDLLGKDQRVIWYQSPYYRLGLKEDRQTQTVQIFDLRVYQTNFQDPYFLIPNKQLDLEIFLPSLLDQTANGISWTLPNLKIEQINRDGDQVIVTTNNDGKIIFNSDEVELQNISTEVLSVIPDRSLAKVSERGSDILLTMIGRSQFNQSGHLFRDLTPQATYFLQRKKAMATIAGTGVLIVVVFLLLTRSKIKPKYKGAVLLSYLLTIIALLGLVVFINQKTYFVSQSEIDALSFLSRLPAGKVLVYDQDCLWCTVYGSNQPAVFANKRDYVQTFSHKSMIYNQSIFNPKDRADGWTKLQQTGAQYIYLVSYADYKEQLPFSPGDYHLQKVYQNANAQVWSIQ